MEREYEEAELKKKADKKNKKKGGKLEADNTNETTAEPARKKEVKNSKKQLQVKQQDQQIQKNVVESLEGISLKEEESVSSQANTAKKVKKLVKF